MKTTMLKKSGLDEDSTKRIVLSCKNYWKLRKMPETH